jgi:hypothetical protein
MTWSEPCGVTQPPKKPEFSWREKSQLGANPFRPSRHRGFEDAYDKTSCLFSEGCLSLILIPFARVQKDGNEHGQMPQPEKSRKMQLFL